MKNNNNSKFTVVILAAGLGTRLGDLTKDKPKALIKVNGQSIIKYSIEWAKLLNPEKIIVIGGYMFDKMSAAVKKIDSDIVMVKNEEYANTQRMVSLLKAKEKISGGILSFDGDYIYGSSVAKKIKNKLNDFTIFGTSQESKDVVFDMMIKVDKDDNLIEMKKDGESSLGDYKYYFNSLMYCPEDDLKDFFITARESIQKKGSKIHIEEVLVDLVSKGKKVKVCDLYDNRWIEIDNQEELEVAEKLVKNNFN